MTAALTIRLTGRAPVIINPDGWPVLVQVGTALDRYALTVRRHADGRAIVAVEAYTTHGWSGGELLDAGASLPAALARVCRAGGLPEGVLRRALAQLPPEVL